MGYNLRELSNQKPPSLTKVANLTSLGHLWARANASVTHIEAEQRLQQIHQRMQAVLEYPNISIYVNSIDGLIRR